MGDWVSEIGYEQMPMEYLVCLVLLGNLVDLVDLGYLVYLVSLGCLVCRLYLLCSLVIRPEIRVTRDERENAKWFVFLFRRKSDLALAKVSLKFIRFSGKEFIDLQMGSDKRISKRK